MKVLILCLLVFLASCAKPGATPPADAPHATVVMRDGSSVPGKVLESSASEIKLAGDDGVTRTIPMAQVRAVDYGEAAPAPAVASAPAQTAETHVHAEAAAVTTQTYELPAGTRVSVRNEETIDSSLAVEGQTFAAEVTGDVKDAEGAVVIPRGANAQIVILSASKGGKIRGASDLALDLATVSIDGRRYQLSTTDLVRRGKEGVGVNKRTAEYSGGGAAIGAIIGAIAGGGKGAAIGAGAGAGAGAAGQILTKGGAIKIPVESVLTFQLDRALRVQAQ